MPGRTPPEAFGAFVEPLQAAVSCLGAGKIVTSPHGKSAGAVRSWTLNDGAGLAVKGWHLEAEMNYELIRDDAVSWRVTTRAYMYRVSVLGGDVFRIHWHPTGHSDYVRPHVHARFVVPERDRDVLKEHLPTGRITFEEAIEWAIKLGMPSARDDWQSVLLECRKKHLEHRTWSYEPPGMTP